MKISNVGIIGCGAISGIYFKNLCNRFPMVKVTACADLDIERAKEAAAANEGVNAVTVDDLMADPEIDAVVNLTIPKAHYEVSLRAVEAGKHAYCEKPITLTREQAAKLLATAKEKGVLVGNAPDTFMGAGIQTARKAIDDGLIGKPVSAEAFMMGHGHESWHPDPEFYYKAGGGPMFDMGPYYLTALVTLMGPIKQITGSTAMTFAERTITSDKKKGDLIKVDVPTHIAGIMNFANGAIGTITTSFDVWGHKLPCIQVHGTEGSMVVPDPNGFGGATQLKRAGEKWEDLEPRETYKENARGVGVADMLVAAASGRAHRASGELATHVLDAMHAFHDASDAGTHIQLATTCAQPAAMPTELKDGELD
jgi:predicted dehydrogenase